MVFSGAARRGGASGASEIVKLVFQASDEASAVVGNVVGQVTNLGSAAAIAKGQVVGLGNSIVSSFDTALSILDSVLSIFDSINSVLQTESGRQFFEQIEQDALAALDKLVTVEAAVKSIQRLQADGSRKGFVNLGDPAEIEQLIQAAQASEKAATLSAEKFVTLYQETLNEKLPKAFDETFKKLENSTKATIERIGVSFAEFYQNGIERGGGLLDAVQAQVNQLGIDVRASAIQSGDRLIAAYREGVERGGNFLSSITNRVSRFSDETRVIAASAGENLVKAYKSGIERGGEFLQSIVAKLQGLSGVIRPFVEKAGAEFNSRFRQNIEQGGNFVSAFADGFRGLADQIRPFVDRAGQEFNRRYRDAVTRGGDITEPALLQVAGFEATTRATIRRAGERFSSQYQDGISRGRNLVDGATQQVQGFVDTAADAGQEAAERFSTVYADTTARLFNATQPQAPTSPGASSPDVAASPDSATVAASGGEAGAQYGQAYVDAAQAATADIGSAIAESTQTAGAAAVPPAQQAGTTVGQAYAAGFQQSVISGFSKVEFFATSLVRDAKRSVGGISQGFGALAGGLDAAGAKVDEQLRLLSGAENIAGAATNAFNAVSSKIAVFTGVLGAAQSLVATGPFQLLIQQNVELREQLLSTQSSLVSTNRVLQGGVEITDATAAINALEAPVEAAIAKIRQDSLELVGVTSNDLVGVFNILTGQISAMGGGLNDAADLTISFSAALGTLGVPLEQARQELVSIAQAQVTSDSVLAKSIGLTNEQLRLWKQQGTLIDNINQRLEAFRAGNALASQTIAGVTSNIQEVIQEATRLAGEPLIDPIVKQLGALQDFLKANTAGIANLLGDVAGDLLKTGESIVEIIKAIAQSTGGIITSIPKFLSSSLLEVVKTLETSVKSVLSFMQPLLDIIAAFAEQAGGINPFFKLVIAFKALEVGVAKVGSLFRDFAATVPGLGEALEVINFRSLGIVNTFFNLSQSVGFGASSFLLLGKNLQSIPGVMDALANSLGPFAPLIGGLIPQISSMGIVAVGAAQGLGALGISLGGLLIGGLNAASGSIPGLLKLLGAANGQLLELLRSSKLLEKVPLLEGADDILEAFGNSLVKAAADGKGLGDAVEETAKAVDLQTLANQKFLQVSKQAGGELAKQVTQYGLFGAGALLAVFAIDQLILKNEAVREALIGVFNAAVSVGKAILNFVQNPVIAVAAAIVGLVAVIQSGLLPSITATITKFATFAATTLSTATKSIAALQAQMVALARSTIVAAASFARFAIASIVQQFRNLQITLALAAAQIKNVGLAGFVRQLFTAGAAAGGFGTAMSGLSGAFGKAALAAKSFIISTGPIALITVAVIALAEAWNTYNRIQKASEKATKDLTAALAEQEAARKALREELAAAQNEESTEGETGAEEARKAIEAEIERERSKLNKFIEGTINLNNKIFGLGLTTQGLSEEEKDAIQQQYDERIAQAESGFERYRLRVEKFARLGADFTGDEATARLEGNAAALDDYGAEADAASKRVEGLKGEYESLVDQFNNGQISQEEFTKQSEILDKQFEQEQKTLEDNVKSLTELQLAEDGDINKRRELVKAIQETQEALSEGREAELAQKELPRLGSAYDQLSQKVADAADYIKTGTGETEVFAQKIDDLLKNVPTLFEQGFVDEDAAIEALQAVANNVNATAEQQLAAQQEIDKILQSGGDSRVRQIQTEITRINGERAKGNLTDLEAEQQITQLKQQEYATRLEALKENTQNTLEQLAIQQEAALETIDTTIASIRAQISAVESDPNLGEEDRAAALSELSAQEQSLLGQREATQENFNRRREKINKNATDEETKLAAESAESVAQSEKTVYDARVAELDRANQKLLDASKTAESERLTEIARIKASGVNDVEEANLGIQELESRKQVIAEELAVEQARLAALEALDPLSDPDDEEERQAEIRQSRLKTQDFIKEGYEIEAQLLEAQIQLIEQKLAEANRVIANETEARTQELEKQNQLLESLEKSLESQSRLLQARSDFAQTSADSISASLDAIAAGEQSEFRRQQIAQTTAAIKLQALQVQQEYELRSLELEQAQLELAKQRELAENRIAQAKAESELAIGQNEVQLAQERFSRGEISESELRGVELQQQRRQLEVEGLREQRRFIEEDLAVSREVFDLRRAGVELQQRGARRQAQAELAGTLPPGLRQRATAALADQIAQEDFGLADARQLRESGVAFARQLAGQQFNGLPATVGPQSAFDPELEGLSNVAGGGALAAAQRQSGRDFRSQFGQFAVGQGASTPTAAPFQLPQELRGADLSQFQQFGGAQPAAIPERQLAVAASSRSEQREQLRELQALREAFQQQQGGGFTAEITVNADQKDLADQIGQGVRSQLEQVFNEAQRQAAVAR